MAIAKKPAVSTNTPKTPAQMLNTPPAGRPLQMNGPVRRTCTACGK